MSESDCSHQDVLTDVGIDTRGVFEDIASNECFSVFGRCKNCGVQVRREYEPYETVVNCEEEQD